MDTDKSDQEPSAERGQKLRYADFWKMHSRQAIWFAKNVGYRSGALIALLASRLGLSPNVVSILSGLTTVISAWAAVQIGQGNWLAGMLLVIGLQLGFAFDCADGLLARATGQGSTFGMLFDKLIDLTSGMIFPWILAFGAGELLFDGHSLGWQVVIATIAIRTPLSMLLWMKELAMRGGDRLTDDLRAKNLSWKLKRLVAIAIDDPVYRLMIALAWALGWFWPFMVVYHAGFLLILILYVLSSKRDLDAMDKDSQ